ncbi:PAS domain S-box protein [uncultured Desulfobulbus sp.]|uniref:PAS domain S-box protein n=1 Tax=uncultured Desulfobulbus sp. TaxID=239745 RepID=UPI0029C650C0|nr:PAS domain S-box protein [uncultured Desulfobulbus sp.]
MNPTDNRSNHAATLRKPAEAVAQIHSPQSPDDLTSLSLEEIRRMFHELQVHQIELEMQNEELRRTRNEVETAKKRYFELYNLAPVGYCTISAQGIILETNLTAAALLGIAREAMVGQPLSRFIIANDQGVYFLFREQLLKTKEPQKCELRLVHADGTLFWVQLDATAGTAAGGTPECHLVISDISLRKQAKESLRLSENRLHLLVQNSSDSLVIINADGTQRYVSPGAERITGFSIAELEGRAIDTLIHPDDMNNVVAAWNEAVEHPEKTVTVQYRHIHKTREWVTSEAIAQSFLDEPSINGVIASVRDITERVHAEKALKDSQSLLNTTQRFAQIGGWEWNVAEQSMTWTDETYRIHGLAPEDQPTLSAELIERSLACYLPEDRPLIAEAFRRCAESGEPYDLRFPFLAADGRRLWIRTMGEPMRKKSRIVLVRGTIIDITREQQMKNLLQARLRLSEASAFLSLDTLLSCVMDEAETLTGSQVGFFHFVEPDQQTLSLQAWSRNTLAHFCTAEGKGRHYPVDQAGVWIDCIRQRRAVIHNDYPSLPHRKGLPPGHAEVRRELVVPIFRNESIVAVFGVGNKAQEYDQEDIDLVTSLGDMAWDIVLRKRTEEGLLRSEERFRKLLESLPAVAVQGYSPDGTTQYWNQASEQLYGYSAEEAIGRNLLDLIIPPEMQDAVRQAIGQMAETGQPIAASELALMHRDGSRVAVYSSHLILEIPGQPPELFCVDIDLTERKENEDHLAAALAEKEVLLREVHHRVKNNLAAIVGLLDMQRRMLVDPQGRDILTELGGRIRSMSLIHEKLYRADNLARINFQHYLQALISHLRTSFGSPRIHCQAEAQGVEMPLDLAVPCGMIINELVTNALKYAFPGGLPAPGNDTCRIWVRMQLENGVYTLSVADNGVGLPPELDWTGAKTLGMVLIRMLGRHQLGGSYELDRQEGLRFTLTFSEQRGRK